MIAWVYCAYLILSVLITVVVGHLLHRNGRYFVIVCLHGNEPLADAVNHLLLAGYYLVNMAFVVLMLSSRETVSSLRPAIELLATKVGLVCLTLGLMHCGNLLVLTLVRRRKGRV